MNFNFVMKLYFSDFYLKMIDRDKTRQRLRNIDKIKQLQAVCDKHIQALPHDSIEMLKLRYISELTQKEIATQYHIDVRTVRNRTSPVIKALKAELYDVLGDEFSC
ncbi:MULTISPECIES: sigma factor-like helix-turn-helix DNA-binding protein [unclassified Lactococcus]|uniref:sigma factor-like helix-turn-helix DNA-binding protein n=1 Tax=unclassified Lactococcus TaxID=2643510 RepID=UPI0011CA3B96|nr:MULTISPECIES: sigma factor-like helix-turn-helix DNA-binding protein [unclassified Lactococcus]MQW23959.1 hypothetical protein [Lactococcus sp. dk101]TXK36978.1 hypothetical protein FVP42_10205 [Lactococcus sp. dk310]TXK47603.1 hypothetical protein FVP43_09910 [Lactococcus sp. dk322]